MQVQAGMSSASTQAEQHAPADSAVSEPGLDDFDAWDEDTQKQWKRFMKGSRSQEVCYSCPIAVSHSHSRADSCHVPITSYDYTYML